MNTTADDTAKSYDAKTSEALHWFRQLQTNDCAVIHRQSLVYGKIANVYEPGKYVSPHNKKPVEDVVVEFAGPTDTHHAFVGKKDAFVVITKNDLDFAKTANDLGLKLVGAVGAVGKKMKVEAEIATLLVASIFRAISIALVAPTDNPNDAYGG